MSAPVERILTALAAREHDARRSGDGWEACCPAHDDWEHNLRIQEDKDGRADVECMNRCTPEAICEAVGLTVSDLMPAAPDPHADQVASPSSNDAAVADPSPAPVLAAPRVGPGPVLTCLADVQPREVEWLWPGRIALGRLALLVGRPGEGKSFLTADVASRVTTGMTWPDGSECPTGSVILLSAEDDPGDTIRPRLDAHGADVRKVHLLSAVRRDGAEGECERMICLDDVKVIEEAVNRVPNCKLIVVDPIGSYLGSETDAHRDNEVRAVLAPIVALAEKYGIAVILVAHRRKSAGNNADETALGSRAFTGVARMVWHLSRDPDNKSRRLLLPGKNNLAHEGDGMAFTIEGEPARIVWDPEPVAMTADDGLAAESNALSRRPGPEAVAVEDAVQWLQAALSGGPRATKDLTDEWKNGQGGSDRTLRRAKESLGAEAYRPKVPGPWWWRIPDNMANLPKGNGGGHLGHLKRGGEKSLCLAGKESKMAKLPQPGPLDPFEEANGVLAGLDHDECGEI
jgi:putative DNA primase/helicase